jgi:hypothetical protein
MMGTLQLRERPFIHVVSGKVLMLIKGLLGPSPQDQFFHALDLGGSHWQLSVILSHKPCGALLRIKEHD